MAQCQNCETTLRALRTVQRLAHEAWESVAMAMVATGQPQDSLLRSAMDSLHRARGDISVVSVTRDQELEALRQENAELKYKLARYSRAARAVR